MRRVLSFVGIIQVCTSLVLNSRDEMRRFLTGIIGDLEEECRSVMLHDNMDLSRLMVHDQQVEYNRKKRDACDFMRPSPPYKVGPNHGDHINNFGVRD